MIEKYIDSLVTQYEQTDAIFFEIIEPIQRAAQIQISNQLLIETLGWIEDSVDISIGMDGTNTIHSTLKTE